MIYESVGYDEMFSAEGAPRTACEPFVTRLQEIPDAELRNRQQAAELNLHNMGITFNVYGHEDGTEKVWPFDLLPRIIDSDEWQRVEQGLKQRIHALNLFVSDIYNEQHILRDGIVPRELLQSAKTYREQMAGFKPPQGVWCHISGVDLIRHADGTIYVLEDNLRCPSGVSYVLENREVMKRAFAKVFEGMSVVPVEEYPEQLLQTMLECAPPHVSDPTAVVLTPGIYNSAYFEHTFLAQQMGVELVQGSDLIVDNGYVYMRTTKGVQRVDVIYRRIDDDFLDPKCFREDSCLGVAGLIDAYRRGNVTLANAPGTGVADDKAVYAYVPQIIKYYLGEDAILSNVPTYICSDESQRDYVIHHLDELVVKPTNESGGYGILMGPQASQAERDEYVELIKANPRNYIAQPMLQLSTVPTLVEDKLEPRHVDLRPFVLCGKDIYVMPGGLTRVALRRGSMVVNSSQGGGSKDTWVLRSDGPHSVGNHNAHVENGSSNA
ncbi:circularly permuted type 2 ATP-grasp protein [Aeoliella sp. ICT_H6.2]|uniref:Circularly permuted type 2 ATP-grasp protein n=1 Tax=Aeoliella straminimaris TaxID=2954799 RepID=A0A9X2FE56_9BACT|nr:circularly permuted type 2 ATP-grasp protein [Aeoliella straminimaris]MCO6046548.1 circularly permuted type 2 ATP-grasp protein [Aeoliella straminimaris]